MLRTAYLQVRCLYSPTSRCLPWCTFKKPRAWSKVLPPWRKSEVLDVKGDRIFGIDGIFTSSLEDLTTIDDQKSSQ